MTIKIFKIRKYIFIIFEFSLRRQLAMRKMYITCFDIVRLLHLQVTFLTNWFWQIQGYLVLTN